MVPVDPGLYASAKPHPGPQTLWGFQLASGQASNVGLAAGVGVDLPPQCRAWLEGIGVDTSGLVQVGGRPTPRAWQVFEFDGKRTQIWRVPEDATLYNMLRLEWEQMPAAFQSAANFHIGVHPLHPPLQLMDHLRKVCLEDYFGWTGGGPSRSVGLHQVEAVLSKASEARVVVKAGSRAHQTLLSGRPSQMPP